MGRYAHMNLNSYKKKMEKSEKEKLHWGFCGFASLFD